MMQFKKLSKQLRILIIAGTVGAISIGLFFISRFNYLLFHTSAELFSIIIAVSFFIIVWNAREYSDSTILVRLGIAYLFIACLDLLHTLSYKGMEIFTDYDYYANQLWIATRYIESLTLFILLLLAGRRRQEKAYSGILFIVYFLITAAVVVTVFIIPVFPVCFIEGSGLTPFKIVSEYIISAFLAASGVILFLRREHFDRRVYRFLLWSIVLTIGSELAFTFYVDNYGILNFIGHMLKIGSFYFIYKAIIETAFKEPVELLFQKLRKSNMEKDRLFSIIAHDLKNPFSGIESSSKLLLDDYDTLSDDEKKEFLSLINRSAQVSTRLLDNLLMWAQVQTGKMQVKPRQLRLNPLVREATELYLTNIKQKDLTVRNELPEDFTVSADGEMIFVVLRNLLSNAIKFTRSGGEIVFEPDSAETVSSSRFRSFSLRDSGVGMSARQLESLFVFGKHRSTSGTENEEGSGLGLILCKEFVELNGGSIKVSSQPGKGSVFTVILPAT